jgi:uncharacterized protein
MSTTHLLYLHGFRSSPQSTKACLLHNWLSAHYPGVTWLAPQLPTSPQDAMALINTLTAQWPHDSSAVVGSSLGGFYASFVARQRGWPSVVINPAVAAHTHGARLVGEHPLWHDPSQTMHFLPSHVDELRALALARADVPSNTMAIVAKGDEVLDWRDMAAHYQHAQLHLLAQGDHGLSDFEPWLEPIADFLQLSA